LPVVELVRHTNTATDAVLIDDLDAGRQGAKHLLDLGHRHVAIVTGPQQLSTSHARLAGYYEAHVAAGVPPDPTLVVSGPYRRDAARAAALRLLSRPSRLTALIACSNELVIGVLQALAERGIRIPDQISLVGFGNSDWFTLLQPPLTTVALPIEEMAITAVHLLLKRIKLIESSDPAPPGLPVISRFQGRLTVRGSTRAV
jgi:DNA-binding LacI/PurR family transcriptional regulator